MSEPLDFYFEAWNETDAGARRELLTRCLVEDAELIDPTGHVHGISGVTERIGAFRQTAPGTKVVRSTGVERHNDFLRYGWNLVGGDGVT